MYRDPVEAAKARLAEARAESADLPVAREHALFSDLPEDLREELLELEKRSQPAENTAEAIAAAADAASRYAKKARSARDLLAQMDFERRVGGRRKRFSLEALAIPAIVAAAALVLWKGPSLLLDRAQAGAQACFEEKRREGALHGGDCRQRVAMAIALAVPWERAAARTLTANIESRIDHYELAAATAALDRALRDDAARRVLERGDVFVVQDLVEEGAFAAVAASPEAALAAPERAFEAAILAGDLERATELATRISDPHGAAPGAWLCVNGRRDEGAKSLASAIRRRNDDHHAMRLSLAACRGSVDGGLESQSLGNQGALFNLSDPGWQAGRRAALVEDLEPGYDRQRLAVIAYLVTTRDRRPGQLLPLVAPERTAGIGWPGELHADVSTWSQRGARAPEVPGEILEEAARRLTKMADDEPGIEGVSRSGIRPEALADPAGALRRAAWAYWLEAAIAWSRLGRRDRVLAAAASAERLAPPELSWLTGPVRHAIGDAAGGAAVFERYLASEAAQSDEHLDRVLVAQALALASLDRWEQAHATALRATTLGTLTDARWLEAALALRLGRAKPSMQQRSWSHDSAMGPDAWLTLATLPAAERASIRAVLPRSALDAPSSVGPAALFLAGKAADGGDVEMWLDRIEDPGEQSHLLRALVRAEAARWRGDVEAQKLHEDRARALRRLVSDTRTLVLAEEAELGW